MIPRPLRFFHPRTLALAALGCAAFIVAPSHAAQIHTHTTLFTGNTGGYHSYRIPSLIATSNGTLIAVAEGRVSSASDWGNINLVFKRFTNSSGTWAWSSLGQIVGVGLGGWTNPTMVYDPPSSALPTANARTNGRVWIFFNWNSADETSMDTIAIGDRPTYVSYSDDNGATWAPQSNITASVTPNPNTFAWDAVGPGVGIRVVQNSTHVGQLVVPATNRNFYSNDHGASWHFASVPGGTGESTIVECLGGDLLRNDRPTKGTWAASSSAKRRHISRGSIEAGFDAFTPDPVLLDPKCEGSILRYNFDQPDRIIFLNSASTIDDPVQEGRNKMYVRISYDDGATWKFSRWLYDWLSVSEAYAQRKGGYSSMTKTSDPTTPLCVAALVETNTDTNGSIDFHRFNLEWMRNGAAD